MLKLLRIDFEGWTATPRDPVVKIGTINTLLTPTYSMLVGIIECCTGSIIDKNDFKIGFWYNFDREFKDLETTHRLQRDPKSGKLSENKETSITNRKSQIKPELSLFINRIEYEKYFKVPAGIPCLGQSQDIMWIKSISLIEGKLANSGKIKSGMILLSDSLAAGEVIRCVDSYIENDIGYGRNFRKQDAFIASNFEQEIKSKRNNIFISDSLDSGVYLYEF
jgi:CRISPR-associated protein Cas5t